MIRLILLTILGWAYSGCMDAQNVWGKMTPWVRQAVKKEQVRTQRAPGIDHRRMTAFVLTKGDQAQEVLEAYGCRTLAQQGDISIVSIPMQQLRALSEHPDILRIEANQRAQCTMDTTAIVHNVTPMYTATSEHQAYTGEGVVVGVMDVGFDLTCPTFYTDATPGNYRIGAFWDQLSPDTIGSNMPVGRDYVGADEILAKQCSTDSPIAQHGSHTAGIAAGSGYDSAYRGIAFGSELCLVSNAVSADTIYIAEEDYYKYTSATDALGFQYIFDYAQQQGKPCVASFSEGYAPYFDQEDSLYNAYLDMLQGPGRILLASAGNEGTQRTFIDKPAGTATAGAFLQAYHKDALYKLKTNGPVDLHLMSYDNSQQRRAALTLSSYDGRLDSLLIDTLVIDQDTCTVIASRYPSAFVPTDSLWMVQISAPNDITNYRIALVAEGSDSDVQLFGSTSYPFANIAGLWSDATFGHNVLAPGCFPATICVGAMCQRMGFRNIKGEYTHVGISKAQGVRSFYSSQGPTMDGRIKPEVMASGDNLISAGNSFYNEGREIYDSNVANYTFDGRTHWWVANTGTSMACPVAAGIVALWLQAKPTLTPQDVLDIISRTSRQPEADLSYPNNDYGWGEIDGYRGLLDILGLTGIEGLSMHQPQGVKVYAQNGLLHIETDAPLQKPLRITVYSLQGIAVHQATVNTSSQHVTLPLPVLAAGVYAVQLSGAICGGVIRRFAPISN